MTTRKGGQIAVVLVVVAFLLGSVAVAAVPAQENGAERVVRIEASQYAFNPGVVNVRQGDHVTIELVATDVVHGLYLDGYSLQLSAEPGKTERLTFVANRSGTFRFRCSVTCGAMHPFMIGKLRVGNNQLAWAGAAMALVAAAAGLRLGRREA